jgi:hypothetical protein
MRKGIVMEVDDPYLTLLTSDGEFLRARKMDRLYSIGEEIDFYPVTDYQKRKEKIVFKNFFTLKTVWMSMAVLIISLGSIIPVYQNNKAYAYMSIDANTSIEMGLNKNMQVVELKGFNKEAEQIISQLDDWEKKDASELTAIIVEELKDEGYISQAEPVVISTVKTHQLKDKAATKLQENIAEIKQTVDKHLVEINMYTTTEAELEKAQDSGVPVGEYQKNKNKNNSAQNKEKIKQKENAPLVPATNSTMPPGQVKKQEQNNSNLNQKQSENNNHVAQEQGNGMQNPPSDKNNNGNNNGKEHRNSNQGKQKENKNINKQVKQKENKNINKQEKPKTNNENKAIKHENNGKK